MTLDQARQLGEAQTIARLRVIAAAHGKDAAAAYARGMAEKARDAVLAIDGPRRSYDWFQVLADQCADVMLPRGGSRKGEGMGRIRSIKPDFPQSESIGRLSRDARLLFLQLFTLVDDAGRARAPSRMLANLLYPYDDDARTLIDGWLDELEQKGRIRRYEAGGSRYLEIINWLEHQKIDRPSKSKLPSFDEASTNTREASTIHQDEHEPSREASSWDRKGKEGKGSSRGGEREYAFESGVIRLSVKDFEKWKEAFSHLDLKAELIGLTKWADDQGTNWFHAVSAALAKRNREIGARIKTDGQPKKISRREELYREGFV